MRATKEPDAWCLNDGRSSREKNKLQRQHVSSSLKQRLASSFCLGNYMDVEACVIRSAHKRLKSSTGMQWDLKTNNRLKVLFPLPNYSSIKTFMFKQKSLSLQSVVQIWRSHRSGLTCLIVLSALFLQNHQRPDFFGILSFTQASSVA